MQNPFAPEAERPHHRDRISGTQRSRSLTPPRSTRRSQARTNSIPVQQLFKWPETSIINVPDERARIPMPEPFANGSWGRYQFPAAPFPQDTLANPFAGVGTLPPRTPPFQTPSATMSVVPVLPGSWSASQHLRIPMPVDIMEIQPSTTTRRPSAVKRVRLVKGHLRMNCPVPSRLLDDLPPDKAQDDEFKYMRYTAVTCDPDDFKNSYSLRTREYQRTTELFVVVTMYNEDIDLFCRTMHGIMRNIQHLCNRSSNSSTWDKDGWKKVVVCIVADGRQQVNERVLNVLATLGVYQPDMAKSRVGDQDVQAHVYEYTTQLSVDPKGNIYRYDNGMMPCQVLFCLKEKNAKKINSHRWFFRAFAPLLNPTVCVLIDVGTRPGDKSLYSLWKAFHVDPNVGGACGEIGVMKGFVWWQLFNPLVAAQHFEYKMSNILDKPAESFLGYIMVLPGAFSAYRYKALLDDDKGRGPLASYFKGEQGYGFDKNVQPTGIFTANMYLAEDRILCFELVAKRREKWVLRYVSSAYSETDVPNTVAEFMVQRRRWLNGSFFAAVYAITHWGRILVADHSIMRKLAFFLQLLYTVFNLLFSWFGLANFFLAFDFLLTTMANPKIDPFGGASQLIHTVLQYAYAIIMLTVLISCLGNRPQGAAWVYAFIMLFFAVLAGYLMFAAVWLTIRGVEFVVREVNRDKDVSTASVLFGNDTFRDIVLALGSTYGTYIISAILYLDPWHMVTSFVQYIFLVPSFINVLQMYAFCNTHDVSWGTKAFWKPPTKDVATTLTPQPGDEELSVAVTVPQDL